jgi:hypothetical protein
LWHNVEHRNCTSVPSRRQARPRHPRGRRCGGRRHGGCQCRGKLHDGRRRRREGSRGRHQRGIARGLLGLRLRGGRCIRVGGPDCSPVAGVGNGSRPGRRGAQRRRKSNAPRGLGVGPDRVGSRLVDGRGVGGGRDGGQGRRPCLLRWRESPAAAEGGAAGRARNLPARQWPLPRCFSPFLEIFLGGMDRQSLLIRICWSSVA